ncbi:hypothetical protein MPTK1_7g01930 [Marchantia polymorpha subsp. ruderalis]|uniref:Uncharacterized protein n=2 Tax=Marchantia polymorpha TaxID=3197 RepID=A0AAF6BV83_MARPO|nr:hypothetical protein MARPO_0088s0093 [Marchantia polymorpha]BBN15917.1 hypothetical protein Mp_7g01930 [Marchantia polymorpha subsp. ruderalis]|eukprot:PTQ33554.1 hypothetical protein MARPO_0088s0093 [Marchantia polymorpha]
MWRDTMYYSRRCLRLDFFFRGKRPLLSRSCGEAVVNVASQLSSGCRRTEKYPTHLSCDALQHCCTLLYSVSRGIANVAAKRRFRDGYVRLATSPCLVLGNGYLIHLCGISEFSLGKGRASFVRVKFSRSEADRHVERLGLDTLSLPISHSCPCLSPFSTPRLDRLPSLPKSNSTLVFPPCSPTTLLHLLLPALLCFASHFILT